mgnify:CR=1 FL=1
MTKRNIERRLFNMMCRGGAALALVLVLSVLSACSYVPLASLYRLRNVSLETVDPGQIQAAVELPEQLRPRTVRLEIAGWVEGEPDKHAEQFILTPLKENDVAEGLPDRGAGGTQLYVFGIARDDLDRFRAARDAISERKLRFKGRAHGSLSVGATACRTGAIPPETALLTSYVRFDEETGFVVLTRNVDLLKVTEGKVDLAAVPMCGN